MDPSPRPTTRLLWLGALLLVTGVVWLRWPSFDFRVWNVDEAIHSAVARILNDGGVLYRDAIDQRTPLSYYLVAWLYRVFGEGNIGALHAFTALLIALTALVIGRLGRRVDGLATGIWAAVLYAVLSTGMMWHGDAFAFNTEWLVAFFTSAAALVLWRALPSPGVGALMGAGALYGLAFLSKQPALLDLGAAGLLLAWLARGATNGGRTLLWRWALLVAGFAAPVLVSVGYFALHGALRDYLFYTFTYNLTYYGPEITLHDRIDIFWYPFTLLARSYPLVGLAIAVGLGAFLVRLVQRQPAPGHREGNAPRLHLLLWTATALAAAASSGRSFEHYYIQALPPLCLAGGWTLAVLSHATARAGLARGWRAASAVILVAVIAWGAHVTWVARHRTQSVDPSLRAAEFVRDHSYAHESMFVWGYHPDAYLFADRRAASRYIYSSFVSGLIPWTNTDPTIDTAYAIVPGAMDTLLADLTKHRPAFLIDASEGPNRSWDKYPLVKFPALRDFVGRHYLMVEPEQFLHQGFGVYLITDAFRAEPLALDGGETPGGLELPLLMGPASTDPKPTVFTLLGRSTTGRLQRLELLHGDQVLTAVSFAPTDRMTVRIPVPFDRLGTGQHTLMARATDAQGQVRLGDPQVVTVDATTMQPEQLAAFALPQLARSTPPTSIRAAFGANVEDDEGRLMFFAHAPSTITYDLPAGARVIRGKFGLRPQAHAADNPHPSDGAEFQVNLLRPDGSRDILFSKLIRPAQIPAERGLQPLSVDVPAGAVGQIEFIITPGPAGNPSSDWTYWADLVVETEG